jgi:membrane-bound lytic murein transglycosylase A
MLPWESDQLGPFRRLMVAHDTGSAIVGPARADLFFGSGEAVGARAGAIRHRGQFIVLAPAGDEP